MQWSMILRLPSCPLLAAILLSSLGQESLLPQLEHCDIKVKHNASRLEVLARLRNCQHACQALDPTEIINVAGAQCMCADVDKHLREMEEVQARESKWIRCNDEIHRFCRDQYCQSCREVLVPSIVESSLKIPGLAHISPNSVSSISISGHKMHCLDIASSCTEDANEGQCARKPAYMQANCSRSCEFCTVEQVIQKWQQVVDKADQDELHIRMKLLQVEEQLHRDRERLRGERRIRLQRLTKERRSEFKRRKQEHLELLRLIQDHGALDLDVCHFRVALGLADSESGTCRNHLLPPPCSRNELANFSRYTMCLVPVLRHFKEAVVELKILVNMSHATSLAQLASISTTPDVFPKDSERRQQQQQREHDLQMEVERLRKELDSALQRERFLLWFVGLFLGGIVVLGGTVVVRILSMSKAPHCLHSGAMDSSPLRTRAPSVDSNSSGSYAKVWSADTATIDTGSPKKDLPMSDQSGSRVKQRVHAINASQSYVWNGKVIPISSKVDENVFNATVKEAT